MMKCKFCEDPDSLCNASMEYQIDCLFEKAWGQINFDIVFEGWELNIKDLFDLFKWDELSDLWNTSQTCLA